MSTPESLLIDLFVKAKHSTLKGPIIKVVGVMEDNRLRLGKLATTPQMKKIIRDATGQELIVSVQAGTKFYDYPVSALQIRPRIKDFSTYGINARHALKNMKLSPKYRDYLVNTLVAPVFQSRNIIQGRL